HRLLRAWRLVHGADDRAARAPGGAAAARARRSRTRVMPALRKPHRIAFLVPELVVEGADAPNASEVGLLLWVACIEACQRHARSGVHDPEATPLVSQDGHFAPHHARAGATPTDSFYGPTRRDELVWLELALPRVGAVRLHALGRDGAHETFDALGKNLGEQI